mmetsp:Transcript_22531/g.55836  ORF Transcript_22531/g.55836 Transcript_22531/m.55836 type:complete len:101 (+) Transcript_22531:81-383(+)
MTKKFPAREKPFGGFARLHSKQMGCSCDFSPTLLPSRSIISWIIFSYDNAAQKRPSNIICSNRSDIGNSLWEYLVFDQNLVDKTSVSRRNCTSELLYFSI